MRLLKLRNHKLLCGGSRYRLQEDVTIYLGECFATLSDFICSQFKFSKGWITIFKGYEWDGCSGGVWVFEVWDGNLEDNGLPQMYYPSLVHDVLYEYMEELAEFWGVKVDSIKKWADNVFLALAQAHKFEKAYLYYWAVKHLGGIFHWINKGK